MYWFAGKSCVDGSLKAMYFIETNIFYVLHNTYGLENISSLRVILIAGN